MRHAHFKTYFRLLLLLALVLSGFSAAYAAPKEPQYVVVIDAGHGGKDHGAMDNGSSEKNINLAVALKVGEYIKKQNKNVKVVYTRTKDEYLTLQQRAEIANKAKGDLFISIHVNSVDAKNPNRASIEGASTYTLGLHKEDSNAAVARRENSVITLDRDYEEKYSGFDPNSDESYIIFEMAQTANLSKSVKFAEEVQRQMSKQASRKDRGVHQAGFWVLWATSMPAALVELDFICNPKSVKYMTSDTGVTQMARSIATAATNYFKALTTERKNRLKAEQEKKDAGIVDEPLLADGQGVVLSDNYTEVKKTSAPAPKERNRRPATRRRRSDAAREQSERQQYALAVIRDQQSYVDDTPQPVVAQADPEPAPDPAPAKSKKKDKKKDKKKAKPAKQVASSSAKPQKKADATTLASASSAQSQKDPDSPARLSKVTTVYKIQILSSSEHLKAGNPLFHGLSPVTCFKQGDEYRYFYGESTNRNEIYQLLADVQQTIPDAQVVAIRREAH